LLPDRPQEGWDNSQKDCILTDCALVFDQGSPAFWQSNDQINEPQNAAKIVKTGARLHMSEAMSRREIEDILTSIRKLVSHDPAGSPAGAARPERGAPSLGKLVLTSALRVPEDTTEVGDSAALPDNDPILGAHDTALVWPSDEMLNEHASTPVTAPNRSPLHLSEPAPETSASLLSRITRSASSPPPASAPPVDPTEPESIAAGDAGNIDAAPQDFPAAIADVQDWLDDADIPVPFTEDPVAAMAPEVSLPDAILDSSDIALEETLARLEAVLSGQPEQAPEAASPVAPAPIIQDDPQSAPAETAAAPQPNADDTAMIDEAMLYQLVANIVRQELQGELGEKITRAIRKLVRAEVARELQLRNM